jgi:hypothetical protein
MPTQLEPLPYLMPKLETQTVDAPIVMVGDRMGVRLEKFKDMMAATISTNLSKPIKIETLSSEQFGLHRTIQLLENIKGKFPKIIIYHGASEEEVEYRFLTDEHKNIMKNFELYNNPKIQTLLILFPILSKFIYEQINHIRLDDVVVPDPNTYTEKQQLKRVEVHYKMFEVELERMLRLIREKDSIAVLFTTPINPNVQPKITCPSSQNADIDDKLKAVINDIKRKDYKTAYKKAKIAHYLALGNAQAHYIFSRVAKQLGRVKEAHQALEHASSYDCKRWRSDGVYNAIIRKMAKKYDAFLFDFDYYLRDNWKSNITFFDDIYAQDLYYQNAVKSVGRLIKKSLRL